MDVSPRIPLLLTWATAPSKPVFCLAMWASGLLGEADNSMAMFLGRQSGRLLVFFFQSLERKPQKAQRFSCRPCAVASRVPAGFLELLD